MPSFLDFEKPIAELQARIDELREAGEAGDLVVSVSVLAWFLDRVSGVFPGGDGADVSIAPSPGGGAAPGAGN